MSNPVQPVSEADSKLWAMFAHLSGIVLLVVGPLVIMLVQGPKDAFVKKQATEALNWQILVLIGIVAGWLLALVTVGLLFFVPLFIHIAGIVFMILGGIKANQGEDYRYPFNWRLVK